MSTLLTRTEKATRIEITWSLNPGINVLKWRTEGVHYRDPIIWNTVTMNRRMEIPPSKFRLLFAEDDADALLSSVGLGAVPLTHERTVITLLPYGMPVPHLLDSLLDQVKEAGVYFDCKVDVTHVPTGEVLLKGHSLGSGFKGVRVVSAVEPEVPVSWRNTDSHTVLYISGS
ncbi:hypothetical protein QBC32DRAFT_378277 [Pseudoneurospora amorphoporcata]|uniref:Uncharacterized protein n=1 Tax=Pseudoneurospora amorphoporcata TaxID=241081 RepID=A0AAN6SCT7_9PEZI|nr:hypothetical protein QBC32DRAFT_378277 [Pseudoneurospora amorphoporcata]